MASELIAYCGLYCGACSFRLAAEENNRAHLRAMPADYDQFKEQPLEFCPGCRLENNCGPCGIRDCAVEKGLAYCSQCDQFPCKRMEAFHSDGKPHHEEVLANLNLLKDMGEAGWLDNMKKKWTCRCGAKKSWYYDSCSCERQEEI